MHNDRGRLGEKLAEEFFVKSGYKIKYRNWRHSHYEIDLIAEKEGRVHFIEVKLRTSPLYGMPEESVTKQKIRDLLRAAESFLYQHKGYNDFRIDILSIILQEGKEPVFFLLEDIYTW